MVDEAGVVARLRAGDERAFAQVVDAYTPAMLRLARLVGLGPAAAEDAVQDSWLRAVRGLDGFEGRSSFRTWLFTILTNCARKRLAADGRTQPFGDLDGGPADPVVDDVRFFPPSHPRWAGMWTTLVESWDSIPDDRLLAGEARQHFRDAIEELPERQAAVFLLRDVEGWSSEEVCEVLELTPENQRVLLHRARNRVRARLEEYFAGDDR